MGSVHLKKGKKKIPTKQNYIQNLKIKNNEKNKGPKGKCYYPHEGD